MMCDDCHHHSSGVGGVFQTLDEIDFAKGPWNLAVNGDYPGIQKYLSNGGEPSIRDASGYSPLHYAARAGNYNICKELIAFGVCIDQPTKSGKATALHRAAGQGHVEVAKLLLEHRADPHLVDDDGKTPLHKAAEGNHSEVCRLLVDKAPETRKVLDKRAKYPKDYISCSYDNRDTYKILWWS